MKVKINPSMLNLVVIFLVTSMSIVPLFPWRVTAASAPLDIFSGERAFSHLPTITREPHPPGSPAQALVRDYLVQQLTDLGLEVEVQQTPGVENVVARIYGTDPSGAILLQAHYDSIGGPGAADNGTGVAALLEIARALAAGPSMRNDIIVLFADSEELPDPFTGTKAFVRAHPWMADVRVAISMDTAVRGFISINDTGPDNGWIVQVLARAYTGGTWSSLSGGGGYDSLPFRQAGIRVLQLEDNYPFREQHTSDDVPDIVRPGSVQQLGEQVLAIVRELSNLNLDNTSGEQQTYMYVPMIGLAHYPEVWALPLAIVAGVLLIVAVGMALWRKLASGGFRCDISGSHSHGCVSRCRHQCCLESCTKSVRLGDSSLVRMAGGDPTEWMADLDPLEFDCSGAGSGCLPVCATLEYTSKFFPVRLVYLSFARSGFSTY